MVPPVVVQLTAVFTLPVSMAVNCWVACAKSEAVAGLMDIEIGVLGGGVTGAFTDTAMPTTVLLYAAVIDTDVSEVTLPVETAKSTDVWPAVTVTLAGTLAAEALLLVNVTVAPRAGAAAFNVTVADVELPAATLEGLTVTLLTDVAVVVDPPLPVPVPPLLAVPPPGLPVPDPVVPQPIRIESTRTKLTVSTITRSCKPILNFVLKLAESTIASPNRRTSTSTPSPRE
jgi:hypothetical protein